MRNIKGDNPMNWMSYEIQVGGHTVISGIAPTTNEQTRFMKIKKYAKRFGKIKSIKHEKTLMGKSYITVTF